MRYLSILFMMTCLSGCGLGPDDIVQRNQYLENARKHYANKQYSKMLKQTHQALELDPLYSQALILQGWACFELNNAIAAEQSWHKALQIEDSNPSLQEGLGRLYFQRAQQETDLAVSLSLGQQAWYHASKAHKLSNDQWQLQPLLGDIQLWLAEAWYTKALVARGGDAQQEQTLWQEAKEHHVQAVKIWQNYVHALDEEFATLQQLYEQSRKRLATEKDQEHRVAVYQGWQQKLAQNRDNFRQAQIILLAALSRSAVFFDYLARASLQEHYLSTRNGYIEEVKKLAQRMSRTEEELYPAFWNLARVLRLEKDYSGAIVYLEKYVKAGRKIIWTAVQR